MMTKLIFLAILAAAVVGPLGTSESAADSHICVAMAVLSIEPHAQISEDDGPPMGGWFPIVCRHGAKFTKTGRPADIDINDRPLAGRDDFTEICGFGLELGEKVSDWITNLRRDDHPTHSEDRICLALHPVGLYCGARANMAEVMSFRMVKGELPVALNKEHCPDR